MLRLKRRLRRRLRLKRPPSKLSTQDELPQRRRWRFLDCRATRPTSHRMWPSQRRFYQKLPHRSDLAPGRSRAPKGLRPERRTSPLARASLRRPRKLPRSTARERRRCQNSPPLLCRRLPLRPFTRLLRLPACCRRSSTHRSLKTDSSRAGCPSEGRHRCSLCRHKLERANTDRPSR